jgi:hypothetical protein
MPNVDTTVGLVNAGLFGGLNEQPVGNHANFLVLAGHGYGADYSCTAPI